MPLENDQKIISALYALSSPFADFDALISQIERGLDRVIPSTSPEFDFARLVNRDGQFEPSSQTLSFLTDHMIVAQNLQQQLISKIPVSDWQALLLQTVPNPALLFDETETITHAKVSALFEDSFEGKSLSEIFSHQPDLEQVRHAMRKQGSNAQSDTFEVIKPESEYGHAMVLRRVDTAFSGAGGRKQFALLFNELSVSKTYDTALIEAYGLTTAECAIAFGIAAGQSPVQIAEKRDVSLQTVRTQIKAIKAKTGAEDIPGITRIVSGINAGANLAQNIGENADRPNGIPTMLPVRSTFVNKAKRNIDFVEQGDPNGRPVITFHNLPYGVHLKSKAAGYAKAVGLRLIAPYRSGYGNSSVMPTMSQDMYLNTVADETAELLEHLNIARAVVLGNVCGSSFGLRFASRHPDIAAGLLCVSRAPTWDSAWWSHLSLRHRVFSMAAKFTPTLAVFIARAIMAQIKHNGAGDYMRTSCGGSTPDLKEFEDKETLALLKYDILFGLKGGVESYLREWLLLEANMVEEANALDVPLRILHGAQDKLVPSQFSQHFVSQVGEARLDLIPDAGHFLYYSHGIDMIKVLDEMASGLSGREKPMKARGRV